MCDIPIRTHFSPFSFSFAMAVVATFAISVCRTGTVLLEEEEGRKGEGERVGLEGVGRGVCWELVATAAGNHLSSVAVVPCSTTLSWNGDISMSCLSRS